MYCLVAGIVRQVFGFDIRDEKGDDVVVSCWDDAERLAKDFAVGKLPVYVVIYLFEKMCR